MNTKQIFLTIMVLFAIDSVAMSQVKKQYRDDVHKSTTVVIKEDGANDLDILNSQFNLDDYKVNEQIKITTDQSLPSDVNSNNVSGGQSIPPTAPDLTSATVSATPAYERPKTKMKRWSVRPKKENTAKEEILEQGTKEETVTEIPTPVTEKKSRRMTSSKSKKASNKNYRKKSKKVKKKKRKRKLRNRKHKVKRNRKLGCYKF